MRLIQTIQDRTLVNPEGDIIHFPTGSQFVGEITSLPGCPDVAVSHAMYCRIGKRRGNAGAALQERMSQCRELGYSAMICTVVKGNIAEEKTLIHAGFEVGLTYTSPRTGNTVCLWSASL